MTVTIRVISWGSDVETLAFLVWTFFKHACESSIGLYSEHKQILILQPSVSEKTSYKNCEYDSDTSSRMFCSVQHITRNHICFSPPHHRPSSKHTPTETGQHPGHATISPHDHHNQTQSHHHYRLRLLLQTRHLHHHQIDLPLFLHGSPSILLP